MFTRRRDRIRLSVARLGITFPLDRYPETPNPRNRVAIFCARFSASPAFSMSRCPFDKTLVARYPATFTFDAPIRFA